MAFDTQHSGPEMAEINMTPLIDVLLVLIVIFMVITPLTPLGLEAQVPHPASDESISQAPPAVVITALGGGQVDINRERMPVDRLGSRLTEVFQHSARPSVFVQGDRGLEFREVAQIIDVAHGAGIRRIGLMTSPVLP